jgi:hypothetical protein
MGVADSVATIEELVAGATDRRPVRSSDAKSGASFELLWMEGRSCFLKVLDAESDWIMRVTGNTDNWEYKVGRAGPYHRFPDVIDDTIIAMALDATSGATRLGVLMDDVSGSLVPRVTKSWRSGRRTGSCGTWPITTPTSGVGTTS